MKSFARALGSFERLIVTAEQAEGLNRRIQSASLFFRIAKLLKDRERLLVVFERRLIFTYVVECVCLGAKAAGQHAFLAHSPRKSDGRFGEGEGRMGVYPQSLSGFIDKLMH